MNLNSIIKNSSQKSSRLSKSLKDDFGVTVEFKNDQIKFVENGQIQTWSEQDFVDFCNRKISSIYESNEFNSYHRDKEYSKYQLILEFLKSYKHENKKTNKKVSIMSEHEKNSISKMICENTELEKAEILLAGKSIVDELQKIIENLSDLQVEDLSPLVDRIRSEEGLKEAERFKETVHAALDKAIDTVSETKDIVDTEVLRLGGEIEESDMEHYETPQEDQMDVDSESDDQEDYDAVASKQGPKAEPLGRAKKEFTKEGYNSKSKKKKQLKENRNALDVIENRIRQMMQKHSIGAREAIERFFSTYQEQISNYINPDIARREIERKFSKVNEVGVTVKSDPLVTNQKRVKNLGFKPIPFKFTYKDGSVKIRKFKGDKTSARQEAMASARRHNSEYKDNPVTKVDLVENQNQEVLVKFKGKDKQAADSMLAKIMLRYRGHGTVGQGGKGTWTGNMSDAGQVKRILGRYGFSYSMHKVDKINEVTPPGMEDFTEDPEVKKAFKKEYGDRWEEVMYATAWKMYGQQKKESINESPDVFLWHQADTPYIMGNLVKFMRSADAELGHSVTRMMKDIMAGELALSNTRKDVLKTIVDYAKKKNENKLANAIQKYLDNPGGSTDVKEQTEDRTYLDLSHLSGLDVRDMVSKLEKSGLEVGKDFFIKSDHPSWILNSKYDLEQQKILDGYSVEELVEKQKEKYDTDDEFNKGDLVTYKGKEYKVEVPDAQGNLVGINYYLGKIKMVPADHLKKKVSESDLNEFLRDPHLRKLESELKRLSLAIDSAQRRQMGDLQRTTNIEVKKQQMEDLIRQVEAKGAVWNPKTRKIEIV